MKLSSTTEKLALDPIITSPVKVDGLNNRLTFLQDNLVKYTDTKIKELETLDKYEATVSAMLYGRSSIYAYSYGKGAGSNTKIKSYSGTSNSQTQIDIQNQSLLKVYLERAADEIANNKTISVNTRKAKMHDIAGTLIDKKEKFEESINKMYSRRLILYENLATACIAKYFVNKVKKEIQAYQKMKNALAVIENYSLNSNSMNVITNLKDTASSILTGVKNEEIFSRLNGYGRDVIDIFEAVKADFGYEDSQITEEGFVSNSADYYIYNSPDATGVLTFKVKKENSENYSVATDILDPTNLYVSGSVATKKDMLKEDGKKEYPFIITSAADAIQKGMLHTYQNAISNETYYYKVVTDIEFTISDLGNTSEVTLVGNIDGGNHYLTFPGSITEIDNRAFINATNGNSDNGGFGPADNNLSIVLNTSKDFLFKACGSLIAIFNLGLYFPNYGNQDSSYGIGDALGALLDPTIATIKIGNMDADLRIYADYNTVYFPKPKDTGSGIGNAVSGLLSPVLRTPAGKYLQFTKDTDYTSLQMRMLSTDENLSGLAILPKGSEFKLDNVKVDYFSEDEKEASSLFKIANDDGYITYCKGVDGSFQFDISNIEFTESNSETGVTNTFKPFVGNPVEVRKLTNLTALGNEFIEDALSGYYKLLYYLGEAGKSAFFPSTISMSEIEILASTTCPILAELLSKVADDLEDSANDVFSKMNEAFGALTNIEANRQANDASFNSDMSKNLTALFSGAMGYAVTLLNADTVEGIDTNSVFNSLCVYTNAAELEANSLIVAFSDSIITLNKYIDDYGTFFKLDDNWGDKLKTMLGIISDIFTRTKYNYYSTFRTYSDWCRLMAPYTDDGDNGLGQLFIAQEIGLNAFGSYYDTSTAASALKRLVNNVLFQWYKKGVFHGAIYKAETFKYEQSLENDYGIRVSGDASYQKVPSTLKKLVEDLNILDDVDLDEILLSRSSVKGTEIGNYLDLALTKYLFADNKSLENIYDKAVLFLNTLNYSVANFKTLLIEYHLRKVINYIIMSIGEEHLNDNNSLGAKLKDFANTTDIQARLQKYVAVYLLKYNSEFSRNGSALVYLGGDELIGILYNVHGEGSDIDIEILESQQASKSFFENIWDNIVDIWNNIISIFN